MSEKMEKTQNVEADGQVTEPQVDAVESEVDADEEVGWARAYANSLPDKDLEVLIQWAAERQQQLQNTDKVPTKQEKVDAKAEKKEATDDYEALRKEVEELKGQLTKQQQQAQMAEQRKLFNAAVDAAMDEAGIDDAKARKLLKNAYTLDYANDRPGDLNKHMTKWFKDYTSLVAKKAAEDSDGDAPDPKYVKRKLADKRATRGETKAGAAPSREERKFTGRDLRAGNIAEAIKRDLGLLKR